MTHTIGFPDLRIPIGFSRSILMELVAYGYKHRNPTRGEQTMNSASTLSAWLIDLERNEQIEDQFQFEQTPIYVSLEWQVTRHHKSKHSSESYIDETEEIDDEENTIVDFSI